LDIKFSKTGIVVRTLFMSDELKPKPQAKPIGMKAGNIEAGRQVICVKAGSNGCIPIIPNHKKMFSHSYLSRDCLAVELSPGLKPKRRYSVYSDP
jgi:hypothetical protein